MCKFTQRYFKGKVKIMKNQYSHIILYAKHWYERHNIIQDMAILIGEWSGMDCDHVDDRNIFSVLTDIVYPHIENQSQFKSFISNVIHYKWDMKNEMNSMERFIQACMDILSELQVYETVRNQTGGFDIVKELIELDKPDYKILPKRRES